MVPSISFTLLTSVAQSSHYMRPRSVLVGERDSEERENEWCVPESGQERHRRRRRRRRRMQITGKRRGNKQCISQVKHSFRTGQKEEEGRRLGGNSQ
ncbi:unnamed protein product [Musa acuminata subsp. burmannicoides]